MNRNSTNKRIDSLPLADMKNLIDGPLHPEGHLATERDLQRYTFAPKGILKDDSGNIVGIWMKNKKGKRYIYLFAKPIAPVEKSYRVELKDVEIDGKMYKGVPVKVYPSAKTVFQWEAKRRK